jgi:hypothetical protein
MPPTMCIPSSHGEDPDNPLKSVTDADRLQVMALEAYAKQAKNTEAERRACEIRLRGVRKYGQLDAKLNPNPKGGRGKKGTPRGTVSKRQAQDFRKLGAIPQALSGSAN